MWKNILLISVVLMHVRAAPKTGFIFNGDDASPEEWKWMVAIYRNDNFRCGGVLISGRHVLTAAHCVDRSGSYSVVLGDYNRTDSNGDEQLIEVQEVYVHPDWDDIFLTNDIALLRLSKRASRSQSNIEPLYKLSNTAIDRQITRNRSLECYVTGWGYETDSKGYWRLAEILQELEVDFVKDTKCSLFLLGTNGATNICYKARNAATCSGDSGSPLMCYVNDQWTLVGVHSFRLSLDGCRGGVKAGTKVSLYRDWISSLT